METAILIKDWRQNNMNSDLVILKHTCTHANCYINNTGLFVAYSKTVTYDLMHNK